jgi:hypothetical protein
MGDLFREFRATPQETKEARTLLAIDIGSLNYQTEPDLCYVCQRRMTAASCPFCHREICAQCLHTCANCPSDLCAFCALKVYTSEGDFFVCPRCNE